MSRRQRFASGYFRLSCGGSGFIRGAGINKKHMQYLKEEVGTVIAMRDLAKYVDSTLRASKPYEPVNWRSNSL